MVIRRTTDIPEISFCPYFSVRLLYRNIVYNICLILYIGDVRQLVTRDLSCIKILYNQECRLFPNNQTVESPFLNKSKPRSRAKIPSIFAQ